MSGGYQGTPKADVLAEHYRGRYLWDELGKARARADAAEKTLRQIGALADSHSGSDGQPVLLAALYRIAEEGEQALADTKEQHDRP